MLTACNLTCRSSSTIPHMIYAHKPCKLQVIIDVNFQMLAISAQTCMFGDWHVKTKLKAVQIIPQSRKISFEMGQYVIYRYSARGTNYEDYGMGSCRLLLSERLWLISHLQPSGILRWGIKNSPQGAHFASYDYDTGIHTPGFQKNVTQVWQAAIIASFPRFSSFMINTQKLHIIHVHFTFWHNCWISDVEWMWK